ncbi:hypothetical protein FHX81_3595 [Saccharothrix saharensis]|uniref:Uncharacterized protein n=1 Tax=Saccharothrix saharensis TaxID=571190 RepID=A0A543JEJ8_9PSEU|nr:hypothetical protein [Saccharothrix saharensis]TQM81232.1 hypothetical protein FHX81_3595 [Saccharothrix saharensis]
MALERERPGAPDAPGRSSSNSVSGTVHGPVAQIGVVRGDVNLMTGAPVRTRYRETVRRIAPPELVGREAELAELAAFCTSSPTPYRWWRAAAWSGKSALMATFALNPPPGVRVVSFFITARLAAQNDRHAFIDNVLEQLVTLLDQPLPPLLTESTREAHLLGLLTEAAEACRDRGEHLVLLVDGLDEDRGVTTGPDAHSVAALLPVDPPADLRVVVAGRPNPPIPTDVPDHHPLRAPDVVRPLAPSDAAVAVRADMERELKALLHGTPTTQELLGLVAAAGGGLTAADLAELTRSSEWDVDDHLNTVTGRSFSRRPGAASDAYVLGHEELHLKAIEVLGPTRLAAYRERLHRWADGYRDRRWPADTPDYLLRDYFALLGLTGDVVRMLACATDPDRHDRMLDRSGGDADALNEVLETRSLLMADDVPDLVAISRLAVHRDRLVGRNASLSPTLPGLWASLGRISRAVAVARSFDDAHARDLAHLSVVRALVRQGHVTQAVDLADAIGDVLLRTRALTALAPVGRGHDGVRSLLDRQDRAVRLIEVTTRRDRELRALVRAAARLGDIPRALALLDPITDDAVRALAVLPIVRAAITGGDLELALVVADQAAGTDSHVDAIARVATAFGESGDVSRARELLDRITALGPGHDQAPDGEARRSVRDLTAVVDGLDRPEEPEPSPPDDVRQGTDLAQARRRVESIADDVERARATLDLVRTAVAQGDLVTAGSLTDSLDDPARRGDALEALVPALISGGDRERAVAALHRAEVSARAHGHTARRDQVVVWVVGAVIAAGDLDQAEALARSVLGPRHRGHALNLVSRAARGAGDEARARRLVHDAVTAAHSITDIGRREQTLAAIAHTLASLHDLTAAEALADTMRSHHLRDSVLRSVARFSTPGEGHDQPRALPSPTADEDGPEPPPELVALIARGDFDSAEELAFSTTDWFTGTRAVEEVLTAAVTAGDLDRAEQVAIRAALNRRPLSAVGFAVDAMTAHGHADRARTLLHRVELAARSTGHLGSAATLRTVVGCLVGLADLDRAEEVARSIADPYYRHASLWGVVEGILRTGDVDRASAVADSIGDSEPPVAAGYLIPKLAPDSARRAVARGLFGRKWQRSVDVLSRMSPASLEALVRELTVIDERARRPV